MTQDCKNAALKLPKMYPLNCPKYRLVRDNLGNLGATFFVRDMLEGFFASERKLPQGLYNPSKVLENTRFPLDLERGGLDL